VVHKLTKLFQKKLNLLGNYNFIIGEPLRHCVPPPLLPSARGGVWERDNRWFTFMVGQALLPVFAPQGASKGSPFGRMADKSVRPTAKRYFTFMVGQALLPVFAPQGATKVLPIGRMADKSVRPTASVVSH